MRRATPRTNSGAMNSAKKTGFPIVPKQRDPQEEAHGSTSIPAYWRIP
jgi:hypothetical protein